jgi:hypothetical protein
VLVCGSREFPDNDFLWTFMRGLAGTDTVIVGGARGPDRQAESEARHRGVNVEVYPAPWEEHGKAAGPIRNQQMLVEGKPDMVVALYDGVSKGTADMIRRAREAGVHTYVVTKP